MICFGHRGACGHEPENTLRSISKAIELGAEGIEIDVHLADGRLWVIHDDSLERTTNGRGKVRAHNADYLQSLDAGRGERIPTLEEVIELVDRRVWINIELKGAATGAPVAELIDHYVHGRGWPAEQFLVSSFDEGQLVTAKHRLPGLRLGVLSMRPSQRRLNCAIRLGAWSVHTGQRSLSEKFVANVHRHGLQLYVFTVNQPEDIARCRALGVDGVFSDFPERVTDGRG